MRHTFRSTDKLYHYTTFETALKILDSNHLKFGRLCNMNDIHENDKITFADKIEEPSGNIINAFDNEIANYRQISFTIDNKDNEKLGFDLHQMWGLYAEKGEGACLVFDKTELLNEFINDITHAPVSYNEDIESFYITAADSPNEVYKEIRDNVKKIFFHKRKEWEHEQEYRLVKRCPNIINEEYLYYGNSLKFIILNSKLQDKDGIQHFSKINELKSKTDTPILIYGNGLFDYSLQDAEAEETIWNTSEGYDTY